MRAFKIFSLSIVLSLLVLSPITQAQQDSKQTSDRVSQFQISGELLGTGGLYSIFGSYRPVIPVAINIGFSTWSINFFTESISLTLFPVSVSGLLLGKKSSFLEVLGGGAIVTASGSVSSLDSSLNQTFGDSSFVVNVGLGYRYWPIDGGFHFRLTAYGLIGGGKFLPWGGLSLGYAI